MGVYNCIIKEGCILSVTKDSDGDIRIAIDDLTGCNAVYLDEKNAQKVSNELNQLLMEGKGNE